MRIRSNYNKTVLVLAGLGLIGAAAAQDRQGPRRRPPMPDPISEETTGFTRIFDGKTLDGWDGDPDVWGVEDGAIIGRTTAENPLKSNTFLIWRGGEPADFELRFEYRINNTNSGMQFRSQEVPDAGRWVLKGYQADIDAQNRFTGQIYEEKGRGFLALRGQATRTIPGANPRVFAALGDGDELKGVINDGDWNRVRIIARDNLLVQTINGRLMSLLLDDDAEKRSDNGLLGVQIHVGPPMTIEIREVWLKKL